MADLSDAEKILQKEFGEFPLYGFFLYGTVDDDFAEFISQKGSWIHNISGEDCLLGSFENPADWGKRWEQHWKAKLGQDYDEISSSWKAIESDARDLSYILADELGVEKNALPCVVFMESLSENEILYVPIIADKENYVKYFQDLFTAVHSVAKIHEGERLDVLQHKWKKLWIKWILPQKFKNLNSQIQEWGLMINKTETAIISVIKPIIPIFSKF